MELLFPPVIILPGLDPFVGGRLDIRLDDPASAHLGGGDASGLDQPPDVAGVFPMDGAPFRYREKFGFHVITSASSMIDRWK